MTLEQATLILAELRESIIASTMQRNYVQQPEVEKTLADRVQALDVVLKELEKMNDLNCLSSVKLHKECE